MDPITGAALVAGKAAMESAEKSGLIKGLFGPVTEEIGQNWASRYRENNAEKLMKKAHKRAGQQLAEDGAVHPRIRDKVLDEGSYLDDDVMQDYMAGLLIASRAPGGRDDRAAYWANLVSSLSAEQIRLHHAIYSAGTLTQLTGNDSYTHGQVANEHSIFALSKSMRLVLGSEEGLGNDVRLIEALVTLERENLLSNATLGQCSFYNDLPFPSGEPVVCVTLTVTGCLLFLWAYGVKSSDIEQFPGFSPTPFDPPGPKLGLVYIGPSQNPDLSRAAVIQPTQPAPPGL